MSGNSESNQGVTQYIDELLSQANIDLTQVPFNGHSGFWVPMNGERGVEQINFYDELDSNGELGSDGVVDYIEVEKVDGSMLILEDFSPGNLENGIPTFDEATYWYGYPNKDDVSFSFIPNEDGEFVFSEAMFDPQDSIEGIYDTYTTIDFNDGEVNIKDILVLFRKYGYGTVSSYTSEPYQVNLDLSPEINWDNMTESLSSNICPAPDTDLGDVSA